VAIADTAVKKRIREAAEAEERAFYEGRAPVEWLKALEPFDTNWQQPFLETAPYLIVIFAQSFTYEDERKVKHYYVQESVGIATGMLVTAVHHAGLVSLTHTPSPMNFLNDICGRPKHERPYLVLVVGYPAENAEVPVISKKPFAEIVTFL
jgi:nitroreductase